MLSPDYFDELSVDISDRYGDLERRGFEKGREIVIADLQLWKAKEKSFGSGLKAAGSPQRASVLTWPDGLTIYVDRPRSRPVPIWRGTWPMIEPMDQSRRPEGLFVRFSGQEWLMTASPYPGLYDSIESGEWAGPFS